MGLLVDVQLAQIDVLEQLAATLTSSTKGGRRGSKGASAVAQEEAKSLLQEAELIARNLSGA